MATKKTTKKVKTTLKSKNRSVLRFLGFEKLRDFKASNFTTPVIAVALTSAFIIGMLCGVIATLAIRQPVPQITEAQLVKEYWLELQRKSQKEYLYFGMPGNKQESKMVKAFTVKTGRPGERPTPLPQMLGKKYWKIVKKYSSAQNPETAPYFLQLDVPVEDGYFGPVPYNECNGQCSWEVPGYFGLHGINGDPTRLSTENPGSSGCIRHSDKDITYLYNLLEVDEGIRYYIADI